MLTLHSLLTFAGSVIAGSGIDLVHNRLSNQITNAALSCPQRPQPAYRQQKLYDYDTAMPGLKKC